MSDFEATSELVSKGECPSCGSSDANALYDDGHSFCFSCETHSGGPGGVESKPRLSPDLLTGETRALTKRRISEDTCKKFGYFTAGNRQVANYRDQDGSIIGQKTRNSNKEFAVLGSIKGCQLFGQHLFRNKGGKKLIIVEGEIDAMSVFEMNNGWPVVSVPNGASGGLKAVKQNIEFVNSFDEVLLCFDMDDPGQDAAREIADVIIPGRAKIMSLPLKDASDMLVSGRQKEFRNAMWEAKVHRPDGLVTVADLVEKLKKPIEWGLPWCFPTLTQLTFGRRDGEVYTLGAGTGVGKTDWFVQQIDYDLTELNEKVGIFFLEQTPEETVRRICGKQAGQTFHIPDSGWEQGQLDDAVGNLSTINGLHMYDNFGSCEWDVIEAKIRYLHHAEGIRLFYIDHLTALADPANERESLEQAMKAIATLAKALGVIIHLISHLATPEGKPHEEGGRVMIRHFKGSRAIGFWSHFMFGLERNQQDDDEERRRTTTFRCLKDRYTGRSTGETFCFKYDQDTSRLFECDRPEGSDGGGSEDVPW